MTMKEICAALQQGGLEGLDTLLQSKPELLHHSDSLGDLPLHAACSPRYRTTSLLHSSETIHLMARHYPTALATPNGHGMLPLHLACWFGDAALIRQLAELYPPSLLAADENGYLPISFLIGKVAMSDLTWNDTVRALFEFFMKGAPDGFWKVDQQGVLPLQYACLNGGVGDQLLQLYMQRSTMTRVVDPVTQQTPLHVAINSTTRLDIIQKIFEACPQAIFVPDAQGRLPLHQFKSLKFHPHSRGYVQRKLEWLLQADPQAVTRRDNQGKTPLHHLLENPSLFHTAEAAATKSLAMDPFLSKLLAFRDVRPPPSLQPDRNDWLEYAVQKLVQAANVPDKQGNLPLHICIQHHSHEDSAPGLLNILLQHYPGAILATNAQGQTALQMATTGNSSASSSINTLYTLFAQNPCSVLHHTTTTTTQPPPVSPGYHVNQNGVVEC